MDQGRHEGLPVWKDQVGGYGSDVFEEAGSRPLGFSSLDPQFLDAFADGMEKFRRHMVMRIARDEWLYPNMNTGGVIEFDLEGKIVSSLWDRGGERHPQVTSMREHKGYLYLGGIFNNRIGKYRIPGADPHWTSHQSYCGAA